MNPPTLTPRRPGAGSAAEDEGGGERRDRRRVRDVTSVVVEDPRIAARRAEVAGQAHRRRRLVVIVVAAVLGTVAAVVGVLRTPLFAVQHVVVSGPAGVDRATVIRASGVRSGEAIVDVDRSAARAAVMALPSVASARVSLDWPHTVRIVVTAEVPLASVAVGGRTLVIGHGGRVLSSSGPGPSGAPGAPGTSGAPGSSAPLPAVQVADGVVAQVLAVGDTVEDPLAPVVVLVEQLPPRLAARLQQVAVAADGSLSLVLGDGGGTVVMGGSDDLPAKLLAVESVLAGVDLDCLDHLDVRDPTRPTISRRGGCNVGPATVGVTGPSPTTTTPTSTPTTTPTTRPNRTAGQ